MSACSLRLVPDPMLPPRGSRRRRKEAPSPNQHPLADDALDYIAQRIGAKRARALVQAALVDPANAWRKIDLAAARMDAIGTAVKRSPRRNYAALIAQAQILIDTGQAKSRPDAARKVMANEHSPNAHVTLLNRWRIQEK